MKAQRIIIVGCGLFGSIIGKWLDKHGYTVVYIDDHRPLAGSPASAGLIKPSWLGGLGQAGWEGLEVLRQMYDLEPMKFRIKGRLEDVLHLPPYRVLQSEHLHARVTLVGNGRVEYQMCGGKYTSYGPLTMEGIVIVATGAWAPELVPMNPLQHLMGTAFFYRGQVVEAMMEDWAPYKQIKVFNRPMNLIWAGDSTAMLPKSYTDAREQISRERVEKHVKYLVTSTSRFPVTKVELSHTIKGIRPYVRGNPLGISARVFPKTWVVTGGGKMGTVLAGHYAKKLLEEIRHG